MAQNELLTPPKGGHVLGQPQDHHAFGLRREISAVRTLGAHRRFRESEIRRFFEEVGDLTA